LDFDDDPKEILVCYLVQIVVVIPAVGEGPNDWEKVVDGEEERVYGYVYLIV
jgi:hypothetical protein